MKVRFENENLVNEEGISVINEEELIEECIKNVSYSYKVIEIIKYTIRNLGYELVDNKKYRKSSLFNKIEDNILNSKLYIGGKNKVLAKRGYSSYEMYVYDHMRIQKNRIACYEARRPNRFGKKG